MNKSLAGQEILVLKHINRTSQSISETGCMMCQLQFPNKGICTLDFEVSQQPSEESGITQKLFKNFNLESVSFMAQILSALLS